jgi:hypothetical protein
MDEIIRAAEQMNQHMAAIDHALDCARYRLSWYTITGDSKYMDECKEWNNVASIYMNQLIVEQKSETCESAN